MASRRLLLQLGAAAAASSLLAASCCPDAALPPPSRDAPATTDCTDVPRTVDVAAAISRGARRLGPPRHLRSLSDIPADAPAAAASDDIPADAPAASPSGDVAAAAGHFQSTFLDVAFVFLLVFLAALASSVVLALLVAGLVKIAALLASFLAGRYAAARTAREKVRVRPLDQDAVELGRWPLTTAAAATKRPRRPWLRAAPALDWDSLVVVEPYISDATSSVNILLSPIIRVLTSCLE
ncbi:hypothetical protein PAHAL_1G061400 [Panicum hallii]|jgi:hypothetical protein|uniref:Reticulon domain-containing protein n=1 Tax=Panicum hallii TaxID=206008 RepID=A0A2T8KU62_9POAL|nr:hypothetical protein PAHAL_1G061400 [Panicum hallii]